MNDLTTTTDVRVTEHAADNITKIAGEIDRLRSESIQRMQQFAFECMDDEGTIDEVAYWHKAADESNELVQKMARLMWGLSTAFSVSRGGSIIGEDDLSLVAGGSMTVGLIYHGDGVWGTHS